MAELLRPGQSVLDVGCGPGAITRGIADAVGPGGHVVGADLNASMIEDARATHAGTPGLTFEVCDVYDLPYRDAFDIVTAARVLQWLARPLETLRIMARAAKPGGRVVILDYNHTRTQCMPEWPASMRVFHAAFLRWRANAGLDNELADHLAGMFATAGLRDVTASPQLEMTRRGEPGFLIQAGIWAETAAFHGLRMVEDGALTEIERAAAEADHREWLATRAQTQTLYLMAVEGIRPV